MCHDHTRPRVVGLVALAVALLVGCNGDDADDGDNIPGADPSEQPPIELVETDETLGTELGEVPLAVPEVGIRGALVDVVAGDRHVCGLDEAGAVWCWGDPVRGERHPLDFSEAPGRLPLPPIERLVAGRRASCGLTQGGALHCWGGGFAARFGASAGGIFMVRADGVERAWLTGRDTSLAIDEGGGTVLLLADNQVESRVTFPAPPDEVFSGLDATCARLGTEVWCMGTNVNGEAGTGDTQQLFEPRRVEAVDGALGLTMLGSNLCALEQGGELRCWPGMTDLGPQAVASTAAPTALAGGCVLDGERVRCGAPATLSAGCELGAGHLTAGLRRGCVGHDDGTWTCFGRLPGGVVFDVPGLREVSLAECAP